MDNKVHEELSVSVLYGPAQSRRYGKTMGVNLLPFGKKRCNWNCAYCQLGYTDYYATPDDYPSLDVIAAAFRDAPVDDSIDMLVICGNGEPTLHPHFASAIELIEEGRAQRYPRAGIACLSNGAELWQRSVAAALRGLDEVAIKLDAGSCDLLNRVNIPISPACVTHQVRGIKRLHGAVIQSCFVDGPINNATDAAVTEWIASVKEAMPSRVDVYTISRRTPAERLLPISDQRLKEIGLRLEQETGIPVRTFGEAAQISQ